MATLLSLADFKGYLAYMKSDKDAVLQAMLDAVESLLADLTDQIFAPAGTVTDEPYSGSGWNFLTLRRPASSITAIKVSAAGTPVSPDDTIPVADVRIDPINDQRLVRFQNGVFPRGIYNLFLTYEAKANLPLVAVEAVKEAGALLYRIKGSEHVNSQSLGDLGSETFMEVRRRFSGLPMWQAAVEHLGPSAMVLA